MTTFNSEYLELTNPIKEIEMAELGRVIEGLRVNTLYAYFRRMCYEINTSRTKNKDQVIITRERYEELLRIEDEYNNTYKD